MSWKMLKEEFGFSEVSLRQGDHGGVTIKPTTFGGDLPLQVPEPRPRGRMQEDEQVNDSKTLARWAPGVMHMVATSLMQWVLGYEESMKALSWTEHLRYNHTPYRRDCRVCQETLQKQKPHRRIEHPWAGVLSLDTAGPLKVGQDLHQKARYLLVGTYTWLVPRGDEKQVEPGAGEVPGEEHRLERDEADGAAEDDGGRLEVEDALAERGGEEEEEVADHDELREEEYEQPDGLEFRVFRLVTPLPHKGAKETVRGAAEMVMRLQADGYHVSRIHTDQGKEFRGRFQTWAENRNFHVTRTAGDDPQANGRAEVAVQYIKTMVRKALHEAQVETDLWPLAARHINEVLHCSRRGDAVTFPGFMTKVLARKRGWKLQELAQVSEEVRYVAPAWSDHGHWIMKEGGKLAITRYTMRPAPRHQLEEVWLALEREQETDPMAARRRIRGKRAVRMLKPGEHEFSDEVDVENEKKERIQHLIELEMRRVYEEPWDLVEVLIEKVAQLKKMADSINTTGDEILQTKIIGAKQVASEWQSWIPAVESETRSLLEEKEALQKLTPVEYRELKARAAREGRHIEELPSKMVWTLKPDPNAPRVGKRKARWVICGNYEEDADQNNYSGGADATAFRVMLKKAAIMGWSGSTLDVKTAFLNAELDEEEEGYVVIRPPHILVAQKFLNAEDVFLAKKAVYGLRRSPRLLGANSRSRSP